MDELTTPRPHFILIPLLAQGHVIPMVDLAHLLADHGARASVITTPANRARIQGIVDRTKRSGIPVDFVEFVYPPPELGLPDGCENFDQIADPAAFLPFFESLKTLRGPLESYIRLQPTPPCCIISDAANPWTAEVARRTGVPRLVFHGPSCFWALCDQIATERGLYDSVKGMSEPFVIPGIPGLHLEVTKTTGPGFYNVPEWERLRGDAEESVRTCDGVVLNTFQELEPEFVECYEKVLGKKVWTLGSFCLYHKDAAAMALRGSKAARADEHRLLAWLDGMQPQSVIYVSFGTMSRRQIEQFVEVGKGLEGAGHPFIWVVKKVETDVPELAAWLAEFEERVQDKSGLIVRGWSPQLAVLAHPSVGGFVTHCGWNSVLEAISMGVPMVTWPHHADQFLNEKLVVDVLGVGVSVGWKKTPIISLASERSIVDAPVVVTRDEVKKAVSELMGGGAAGEARRAKAEELGEKARKAMQKGGSSFENLSLLVQTFIHKS